MTAEDLQRSLNRLGAVRCGSTVTAPCPLCQSEPVPIEKHHLSITCGNSFPLLFFCHKCQIPKAQTQEDRDYNRSVSKRILEAAGCDPAVCFERMEAGEIRRLWSQIALGSVVLEEGQERQPDRVLSVAYSELLESLHLSDRHRKWLAKRGMDADYCFSIGYRTSEGECESEREWVGVPGCVAGKWLLRPSLLIPCRNREGLVCAIKQRVTDGGKARMRLLSHRGIKARQLIHWPLATQAPAKGHSFWITEGERKADYLQRAKGQWVLGLPGCGSWQRVVPLLDGVPEVVLALDADEAGRKTTDQLGRLLKASGKSVLVAKWGNGKGVDDALAAGEELRLEEFVAADRVGEAQPVNPQPKGSLEWGQKLSDHQILPYLKQFGPQPMHLVKAYSPTVMALLREGRLRSSLTKEGRILEVVDG